MDEGGYVRKGGQRGCVVVAGGTGGGAHVGGSGGPVEDRGGGLGTFKALRVAAVCFKFGLGSLNRFSGLVMSNSGVERERAGLRVRRCA